MHDLQALFRKLNQIYWNNSLPEFTCEWSGKMITTWGCCYRGRKLIRISTFFQDRPLPEIEALLCHEMIHIKYSGHGRRFKDELKRIGLDGDVQRLFPHLNELTHRLRREERHVYQCPRCKIQIRRRRRIRGYCARCHREGINSKFRLLQGTVQLTLDV